MAFLGIRIWPTPVFKPLWPFFVAAGITTYGVAKMQEMGIRSPEYINNPKNPHAAALAREQARSAEH